MKRTLRSVKARLTGYCRRTIVNMKDRQRLIKLVGCLGRGRYFDNGNATNPVTIRLFEIFDIANGKKGLQVIAFPRLPAFTDNFRPDPRRIAARQGKGFYHPPVPLNYTR